MAAPSVERLLAVIEVQNEVASSGAGLEEVLGLVVCRAQELTGADAAVVELVEGDEMVYRAASGSASAHVGLRLAAATSLSGRCVAEDAPLRCDDAERDPRVDAAACRRVGARAMVCVPLRHGGGAVGVLKVVAARPHAFDDGDGAVLRLLSDVIATQLARATALEALREAEERFRGAFDSALVGMCLTAPDGRLLQVNAALCTMLGRSAEELRRCSFRDVTHPEDRARDAEHVRRAVAGELPSWSYEKRYVHASGRTVLAALTTRLVRGGDGAPLYFVTQMQDITERRAAERRAAAQFAATQALAARGGVDDALRGVTEAVCEHLDWAAGVVWLRTPDGALALHGVFSAEPALRDGLAARGAEGVPDGLAAQVAASGRAAWSAGLRPDAHGLGLRATFGVPITSGDEVLGVLQFHARQRRPRDRGLLEAITTVGGYVGQSLERERAQRALAEARDEALRASELKSRFLANTSHEIRTPMNGVLGMTELLLDSPLTAEQRAQAETVRASAHTLLRVIDDILDLSKIEAGKLELGLADVAPRDVVRDVCALLAPRAADAGLVLRAEVGDRVPALVRSDGVRLRQVLTNLVGNALKFTERGEVVVALGCTDERPGRAVLRLAVRDTGIGIETDALGRLFDAFSQVDPSTTRRAGGTGLGLAISRQLVEMLGGRIDVDSRPGSGSTFTVVLPVEVAAPAAERAGAAAPAHRAAGAGAGAGRTVLVAEDNPVNQRVAELTLRRRGWEVVVAADGEEAVEHARRRAFDVVLMDCQMPRLDGYEATRAIRDAEARAGGRRTPIIAMTAHSMTGDRERCLAAGMDDHLTKPFRPDELDAVLARGLATAV